MTRGGERGQVAGIEALPFGVLVCVAGSLLIVNIWGVVDSRFAAETAAREAVRYVAEVASSTTGEDITRSGAEQAARQAFADHGRSQDLSVQITADRDGLRRCARVTARVETSVPALRLPFFGGFGEAFRVVATHSELVDPTRSGVGGRADCIA